MSEFQSTNGSTIETPAARNGTTEVSGETNSSLHVIVVSLVLGLLILATVIGNLFVIAAILLERHLRSIGNYLVLSLAVADLMVACLVMPLSAVYEVTHEWVLGSVLCEVWTSCDVLCCTASILHLLAIAVDRYWAVTRVDYVRQRSSHRIGLMIFLVWGVAVIVSVAPVLGWKDADFLKRVQEERRCLVSQDLAYQIFATCSSFYVPLIIILFLYWKIFQVARKRIRHKPGAKALLIVRKTTTSTTDPSVVLSVSGGDEENPNGVSATHSGINRLVALAKRDKNRSRETLETRRERKAAKTLAIITGVFVICWLPFFVMAIVMPMCSSCEPDKIFFSFLLWLGYINSMLNPIIYTIFSPDFRGAFRRILCGEDLSPTPRLT
ncbi:5-hydroxytryptamine receptor 2A-like [Limulus polyphemus]|uniref:5-hydroxytryptamine receptor 2A-like n=1 Tax=Limulus polyphemus TaxID=6850 RepID=A0ABM1BGW9_LIMPO|nr:5-hydroxytryptamine receptor 2A-like [Limulus polyphemus]